MAPDEFAVCAATSLNDRCDELLVCPLKTRPMPSRHCDAGRGI
jgi:hypothetical protein